jgi:hypothetical protein
MFIKNIIKNTSTCKLILHFVVGVKENLAGILTHLQIIKLITIVMAPATHQYLRQFKPHDNEPQ